MKEVIITDKIKYFKDHYPFDDPPKLTDNKRCIHCGSIITIGDYKVFRDKDGDELIYCPNAPECEGTVIDWFDLNDELAQANLQIVSESLLNTSSSADTSPSVDWFDLNVELAQVDLQIDSLLNTTNIKKEKVYRMKAIENKLFLLEFDFEQEGWIVIKQAKRVGFTMNTFEFLVVDFFSDYFDKIAFYHATPNPKMIGFRNGKEFHREFNELSTYNKRRADFIIHIFWLIKDDFIRQDLGNLYKSRIKKSPKKRPCKDTFYVSTLLT